MEFETMGSICAIYHMWVVSVPIISAMQGWVLGSKHRAGAIVAIISALTQFGECKPRVQTISKTLLIFFQLLHKEKCGGLIQWLASYWCLSSMKCEPSSSTTSILLVLEVKQQFATHNIAQSATHQHRATKRTKSYISAVNMEFDL